MSTAEMIAKKAEELPPDVQREVLDFIEFLSARRSPATPLRGLHGAWADLGVDLSSEDIDEARREMWSGFPRKDV